MRTSTWTILALIAICSAIMDTASGVVSLKGILQPNNILANIACLGGSVIITGMAMTTKSVFSPKSNLLIKALWVVAVGIDAFTTIIATVYYVILGMPLSERPEISAFTFDLSNTFPTIIGFGSAILITGFSVSTLYILEKMDE